VVAVELASVIKMVLEMPDEISEELSRKLDNPARAALEALAAAAYGQNVLSLEQVNSTTTRARGSSSFGKSWCGCCTRICTKTIRKSARPTNGSKD
jgi:hypothetical protein